MSVPGSFVREFFGICHPGYYDRYSELGGSWNRSDYRAWYTLTEDAESYYAKWDGQISTARRHSIKVMPLLGLNNVFPEYAEEGLERHPPASAQDVEQATRNMVERYSQPPYNLRYFEISNEPNIYHFFRPAPGKETHKEFIDRVLIPAARVVHEYGCKVVAPAMTMEWPEDSWPATEATYHKCFNVSWGISAIEKWLGYNDAWRHIDFFSVHYIKGDTVKPMLRHAENLMPLYDYLYENWVKPGKIDGIWNTEEGLTAVEAGHVGQVALEPWEVEPLGQWVPRYTLPVIDWALRHDWRTEDQYKVFWYHVRGKDWVLEPTCLINRHEGDRYNDSGFAHIVLTSLFREAREVDAFRGRVDVGLGLHPVEPEAINYFMPHRFTSYGFRIDDSVLIAAWIDLPGLFTNGPSMQAVVRGAGTIGRAERINYLTGEVDELSFERAGDDLIVDVPRRDEPVLYLRLS
jgi:hypothetical protein